jgi:IclR family pca regulon transcriptional regulator
MEDPEDRGMKKEDSVTTQPTALALNQSVEKALAVLHAFGGERRALNLMEIAAAAGITKSSAQRFTNTLQQLGYLRRDKHAKGWVLSPRVLTIGYAYLSGHTLIESATTHLRQLNVATRESVSLSEPDDTNMVYVARFPAHHPFFIHMPIGRVLPMFCTSAGRAYLSRLPMEEISEILDRSALRPLTPTTVTDRARILELVLEARELGYARAHQESYRGDLTIGAPIMGQHGRPVAAINISGPTSRWTMEALTQSWAPLLMETARAASSGMADRFSQSA